MPTIAGWLSLWNGGQQVIETHFASNSGMQQRETSWLGKTASSCHRQGPAAADVADLGLTRVCSYPLGISSHGPITLNSQYFLPAQHRAAPVCYSADYT